MKIKAIRLTAYNKPIVIDAIRRAPEDHLCSIAKPKKTNPQIRLIYKWFSEIQTFFTESAGKAYTQKQIKIWLKELFGEHIEHEINGKFIIELKSLADYEKEEMSKFMESVDRYMAHELGCFLTQPNQPGYAE